MIRLCDDSTVIGEIFGIRDNKVIHVGYGQRQLTLAREYLDGCPFIYQRTNVLVGKETWHFTNAGMPWLLMNKAHVPKQIKLYLLLMGE